MKICVVTVCRNAQATIGRTLESFFAQDHADKELIVVDGASTDATMAVVRAFHGPAMTVISEPDAGLYDAMNKGLARFTGDAIGYLNSDDRFHDHGVLSDVAQALEDRPIVFGDVDFVSAGEGAAIVRRWKSSPHRPGAFRRGWMAPHPSLYVRRLVAEAVGPFDLSLRIAADYDWMLRAFEIFSFASRRIERTFVDMAVGGASTRGLSAYASANLEALASRRRWLGAGPVDYALVAKPLGKLGQFASLRRRGVGPGLASGAP